MPTITIYRKDLESLTGKRLALKEIDQLLEYGKGEITEYDDKNGELKLEFQDTNMPHLWSVEGIARMFRGVLGKQSGFYIPRFTKSGHQIVVDPSIQEIRPYIGAFVAEGSQIDGHALQQLISLQEKLVGTYGRQRKKVSIGIYKCDSVTFPVHYKAADPDGVSFTPLDFKESMTLRRILHEHPKGKEYGKLIKNHEKYPLLVDSLQEVLSFPPIINSNTTGRVSIGDRKLLVEATGTDASAVNLSLVIFAYALADRGFSLSYVTIKTASRTFLSPSLEKRPLKLSKTSISSLLGISLDQRQVKSFLEHMGYAVNGYTVTPPLYRSDILHPHDVIEDLAIGYGYNSLRETALSSYTQAVPDRFVRFVDVCRDLMIGFGFQEIQSPILTNTLIMAGNMGLPGTSLVELKNPMSETYSAVRNSLLPLLLDFASKNKHHEYPQRIFEQGPVVHKEGEPEYLAGIILSGNVTYTHIRQIIDSLFSSFHIETQIRSLDHPSFIPGRCAEITIRNKKIGFFGEIHPQVLEAFDIDTPCVGLELDLSALFVLQN